MLTPLPSTLHPLCARLAEIQYRKGINRISVSQQVSRVADVIWRWYYVYVQMQHRYCGSAITCRSVPTISGKEATLFPGAWGSRTSCINNGPSSSKLPHSSRWTGVASCKPLVVRSPPAFWRRWHSLFGNWIEYAVWTCRNVFCVVLQCFCLFHTVTLLHFATHSY